MEEDALTGRLAPLHYLCVNRSLRFHLFVVAGPMLSSREIPARGWFSELTMIQLKFASKE